MASVGGGEINYSRCSVCFDVGRDTAARHFCLECEAFFCGECVKQHKTLPVLKSHHISDVNYEGGGVDTCTGSDDVNSSSLKCTLHHDKLVDTYCKDHDNVCCGACAVVKHRACKTVSIDIAAKDFNSSPELSQFKKMMTDNLDQCKEETKKRTDNIEEIGKQKEELIEEVDEYEEKLIARIRELAEKSREEIGSKYEEHKTTLDKDVTALNAVKTTISVYISKLDQIHDDSLLFAHVKTIEEVTRDGELLLQTMATEWTVRALLYNLHRSVETTVDRINSLGELEEPFDVKAYKSTFVKNVNVRHNDKGDTYTHDLRLMDSDDVLVADFSNKKLKRFSSDLLIKDELVVSGNPVAVCKINQTEVAVRTLREKVHFVTVGQTMKITSSFTLAEDGYGIAYDAGTGEMFACETKNVSVYNKAGRKLRTYDKDSNGELIFSDCSQLVLSDNKQDVYVTDYKRGLIVLDAKNGTLKMKVDLPGVSGIIPLCLLPGDICLVGGTHSEFIAQVDRNGKRLENIIKSKDGRTLTYCVVYDRKQARLLVGGYSSVISLYSLSAK